MPERSEVRERVVVVVQDQLDSSDSVHMYGDELLYGTVDRVLAVITQDRAERLAQRMGEIEAATDDLVAAVLHDVAMGLAGSDGASGSPDARARLLAMIREVAG